MKGDIKVLLGCFLGIVLLALLVVTCKETDGRREYYPQLPVTSYTLKTNGDTLNVVETDAKGGNGCVWKLYLKGDEYYMEWLGVEMLMMSTHQLTDSLYTNSMKYQQYRVCIERINDSLFPVRSIKTYPQNGFCLECIMTRTISLPLYNEKRLLLIMKVSVEFKVLFLKSFTIAAMRSSRCV